MVLPAVLRDAALDHLQHRTDRLEAGRRPRHVRRHHRAVLRALARYLEGALGCLSPLVQAVLLAVRRQCHRPRLARLASCRRYLRDHVAAWHSLLLRLLPGDHAGSRPRRDAAPLAQLDYGSGSGKAQQGGGRRAGQGLSVRQEGKRHMNKLVTSLLSLAVVAGLSGAALAEEATSNGAAPAEHAE